MTNSIVDSLINDRDNRSVYIRLGREYFEVTYKTLISILAQAKKENALTHFAFKDVQDNNVLVHKANSMIEVSYEEFMQYKASKEQKDK